MGRPHTERLGAAIADVLNAAGMSQTELARRLRARGHSVDQSRVSKWVRGVDIPHDISIYPAIEDETGVRRGTILEAAGYVVPDSADVVAALRADKRLDATTRRIMIRIYEESAGPSNSRDASPANADENRPIASSTS